MRGVGAHDCQKIRRSAESSLCENANAPSRATLWEVSLETLSLSGPMPRSTHCPSFMAKSLHLTECSVSSPSSPVSTVEAVNDQHEVFSAGSQQNWDAHSSCLVKTGLSASS